MRILHLFWKERFWKATRRKPINEGEGIASTTYSVAQHQLCVESKTRNEDVISSVHNLDRTPDEILMDCNEFLKKHKDKM